MNNVMEKLGTLSRNHQFVFAKSKKVVAKFVRGNTTAILSFTRLHPETGNVIDGLLRIDATKCTWRKEISGNRLSTYTTDYDADVIELYSDTELMYFMNVNNFAIKKGALLRADDLTPDSYNGQTVDLYSQYVARIQAEESAKIAEEEALEAEKEKARRIMRLAQ